MVIGITTASVILLLLAGYIVFKQNKIINNYEAKEQLNTLDNAVPDKKITKVTYLKDNATGEITRIDDHTPHINISNSHVVVHNIVIDRTGNKALKSMDVENPLEDTDEYMLNVVKEYEKYKTKYELK